jgi:hypothetical protein
MESAARFVEAAGALLPDPADECPFFLGMEGGAHLREHATVLLECEDEASRFRAAAGLKSAGYRVRLDHASDPDALDLIVRGWSEEEGWRRAGREPVQGSVPVLTLHLSLFAGAELVDIVERVLGRTAEPPRLTNRLRQA